MARVFNQIISLGPDCRAKYHIRQSFGEACGRRCVFDWQGTPPKVVAEYLRRDFVGMFERDDLHVVGGKVANRRFGTSYKHLFPAPATEAVLDAHYPAVRKSHDRWCKTTRDMIGNGFSTLFVLGVPVAKQDIDEISVLLERVAPSREFLLLPSPDGDDNEDWRGNRALWREHLSQFVIEPPLGRRIKLKLRRLRNKLLLRSPTLSGR